MPDNKALKKLICDYAKQFEADMIGFGPVERFAGTNVLDIYPDTKTVICIGLRVLRGVYRGIEEGTTYYQYSTNGVEIMEETLIPRVLLRLSALLEDAGYTAYPQRRHQCCMTQPDGHNYEMHYEEIYHGLTQELTMDFENAAVQCGLGESGLDGTVLTDRFGPMQRWCCILTNAELEPTPLVTPHLCDGCKQCIDACPGHALRADGSRDVWQCGAYYRGANRSKNPFMPPDAFENFPNRRQIMDGTAELGAEDAKKVMEHCIYYPPIKQGYASSICGKASDVACYVHLEEAGKLHCSQREKFRRRPEWKLSVEE